MSEKNKELVKKINEAFLTGNAETVSGFIDDNIKWNIVGMPIIIGKQDFIKTMEMMELENFPSIKIKNIVAEGDYVVIESSDINTNKDSEAKTGKPFTPSYCDIYFLRNGKVREMTTYIVDITSNNEL